MITAFASTYSPLAVVLSLVAPFLLVWLDDFYQWWVCRLIFWVSAIHWVFMIGWMALGLISEVI